MLALVLVAILGPGLINAVLAITLVLLPHFSRLTRAAVMAEKEREYATAAKLAGAGKLRLMFKTILPNCLAPLVVQATMSFSNAILDVAALGFLGMGPNRQRLNGARCLPKHASSSCAPGGSSRSPALRSSSLFSPSI